MINRNPSSGLVGDLRDSPGNSVARWRPEHTMWLTNWSMLAHDKLDGPRRGPRVKPVGGNRCLELIWTDVHKNGISEERSDHHFGRLLAVILDGSG